MPEPDPRHEPAEDRRENVDPGQAPRAPANPETDEQSVKKGKEQLGTVSGN